MNLLLKRVFPALLLCLLLPWRGTAQNDIEETMNAGIKKVTLPSSNVASLLKFTELPVNYSTGTPDISIPIYTINTGKLSLPVTLRYVASGIRVLENASSVGLGWALSAEGTIQQSIFGLEDNNTYHQNGLSWTNAALLATDPNDYSLLEQLNSNGLDGVPDVYTFSFPGNSGKFIYADQVRCLPQQNLAISLSTDGWKIIGQDGTQYFFTLVETTSNRDAPLSVSSSKAWYLTKIRDANNVDSIVLEYESLTETQTIGRSYSFTTFRPDGAPLSSYSIDMAPNDPPIPGNLNTVIQNTNGWQLKRIIWNSGSLEYDIAWNDREDLIGPQVPRVKNILLMDRSATIKRVIHFDQDYFLSDDVALTGSMGKRLRLQRVTFAPSLATINSATDAYTYSFEYDPLALPSKQSNQIDHWGFFNGAYGNDSRGLIPSFSQPGIHYYGADRNVNPDKIKAAMLTRINYPTGGYAQFDWQVHSKSYPTQLLDSAIVYFDSLMTCDMIHEGTDVNGTWEDIMKIPSLPADMFGAGLSAEYTAAAVVPPSALPTAIVHAAVQGKLYEYTTTNPLSSPTTRATYNLTYNFNNNTANWNYSTNLTVYPGKAYKFYGNVNDQGFGVQQGLKVKWPRKVRNTYTPPTDFIGGLRIAKITLYDKYSDKSIVKKYFYPNCREYGIGPVYRQNIDRWYKLPTNDPSDCKYGKTEGLYVSSNSVHNFNAGVQAAYDTVRESIGENGEGGYNMYVYDNYMQGVGEFPATWRLGRLRSKHSYNSSNVEVARTVYNNRIVLDPAQNFAGHTATKVSEHPCFNNTLIGNPDYATSYRQSIYSFPCDWLYVDTVWNQDLVTGVQTTSISTYDNPQHRQLTRSTTLNSDGSRYTTFIKYPTDFTVSSSPSGDADAIRQLQERHMHSIPIEQYTQQLLPGSSSPLTIAATYNRFGNPIVTQPGLLASTRNYKLELTQGIGDFQPAAISGNNITRDSHYAQKAQASEYDTRANLVSLVTPGNQGMSYIWGYNNAFPIAAIQNNYNSRRAGFTSFEEEASGNWSYSEGAVVTAASQSLTGKRYLDLNLGNVEFYFRPADNSDPSPHPAPPAATYIVSYWRKNGTTTIQGNGPSTTGITGSGWTYCEHLVANPNGPITLSGNAWIDELRIYPVGCTMESFTYDPLNGITSKDDGSGRIIRYDYDIMGRLTKEKDINGNTIKGYQYQYQGDL